MLPHFEILRQRDGVLPFAGSEQKIIQSPWYSNRNGVAHFGCFKNICLRFEIGAVNLGVKWLCYKGKASYSNVIIVSLHNVPFKVLFPKLKSIFWASVPSLLEPFLP